MNPSLSMTGPEPEPAYLVASLIWVTGTPPQPEEKKFIHILNLISPSLPFWAVLNWICTT